MLACYVEIPKFESHQEAFTTESYRNNAIYYHLLYYGEGK